MPRSSPSGKTILVTGGTGSFGTEFTRIVLKAYSPGAIRVYSRGEHRQAEMQRQFGEDPRLRFFIGDVRDYTRLHRAMDGVDLVVHAAALKSVPQIEYNPIEAIMTNVMGAVNVVNAAIDSEVDKVMTISSDKAVYPVNLYGATKMVAEKLFIQGNSYVGRKGTAFSCVRYGNVMGSQGSVLPLFRSQSETGTVTITHPDMTRFWISLEHGVRFVINCIERMKGGEIFVPKIPSARIVDLAELVAPKAKKKIIGIRAGEKIHETLITEEEAPRTREFDDCFVIKPESASWASSSYGWGRSVPDGFKYTSADEARWLNKRDLLSLIKELEA